MTLYFALVVTILFAVGFTLLLQRSALRVLLGFLVLGHAANLMVFTGGGLPQGRPPILAGKALHAAQAIVDPVPHALVLTAIVISFGISAFLIALIVRWLETFRHDDVTSVPYEER